MSALRPLLVAVTLLPLASAQGYQLVPNLVYDPALHLQLDLYLPQGAAPPYPLVVWVHGGGWSAGTRDARSQASQLCPRGFAVAGIDYRLTGVAPWPAQIQDCKGAVRWLRANAAQYGLDPDRVGAWGSSAGGHLVACLGTMGDLGTVRIGNHSVDLEGATGGNLGFTSRVQAVADWFGPTEFVRMREFPTFDHDAANSPESLLVGAPIQTVPDRCATANPISFLTGDDAPLLVMHGTDDTTVPFQQSELLVRAAGLGAGLDVTFFPVPANGHGGPGFQANIQRVFDLFERRLRDLPAVTVAVVASDASASEAGDPGAFTVSRTGSVSQSLVVRLWAGGTATNGLDHDALPSLVTIPAGQASVGVPVVPRQDLLVEGPEAVALAVCPSPDYRVAGAQARAQVVLADDESAAGLPVVTVTTPDPSASETPANPGLFLVTRTGPTTTALTVRYTLSGSARSGLDYAALPGTVAIPAGQASASVVVAPLDDRLVEAGEYAALRVDQDAGYAVGAADQAAVVIADDDRVPALPIVSVELTDVTLDESGLDRAEFALTRTGPVTAPLVLPFTLGGRAQAGADCTLSVASPAQIPAGAAWARIAVTGRADGLVEGEEALTLTLAAGAGWQLASQPSATLILPDADGPVPPAAVRLRAPVLTPGAPWCVTTLGAPGAAAIWWLADAPGHVALGSAGVFQLDPLLALPLGFGVLDAQGSAVLTVPVPAGNGLRGAELRCQAATVTLAQPTLALSDVVVRRVE